MANHSFGDAQLIYTHRIIAKMNSGISYEKLIVAIMICAVNTTLQATVLCFLRSLKRNSGGSIALRLSQHLFAAEAAISISSLVAVLMSTGASHVVVKKIMPFVISGIVALFNTALYFIKVLLFLVEVVKVYFPLQNEELWSICQSHVLVGVSWGLGAGIFSFTVFVEKLFDLKLQRIYKFFIAPGTLAFVLYSGACNAYLLYKLNWSRTSPITNCIGKQQQPRLQEREQEYELDREQELAQKERHRQQKRQQQSFCTVFVRSRFAVPLVANLAFSLFLIFTCIDTFVPHEGNQAFHFATFLLYNVMVFIDAVIYLAMESRIRNMIKKKLRIWRLKRNIRVENRSRLGDHLDQETLDL